MVHAQIELDETASQIAVVAPAISLSITNCRKTRTIPCPMTLTIFRSVAWQPQDLSPGKRLTLALAQRGLLRRKIITKMNY